MLTCDRPCSHPHYVFRLKDRVHRGESGNRRWPNNERPLKRPTAATWPKLTYCSKLFVRPAHIRNVPLPRLITQFLDPIRLEQTDAIDCHPVRFYGCNEPTRICWLIG